jgi:ATP-binding cassette, subfamily B, bacterial HlyB/CyaB
MNQGHLTDIAGAAARSIAILAAFHKSSINTEDALEALTLGSQTPTPRDLVRAIKRLGFSSEQRSLEVDQLTNTLLPALAVSAEGHPFIMARASETKALIQMGPNFRPRTVSIEQLSVMWHGTIILFGASKASRQESPEENFLKNWIWAVARKYRHILLEVLTASFFVQTIALATPIIFQVVIDRVFSYGAQSTLQVMILALIVVGIFEAIINIIRGYLLNHTAARIDVELSSKFFEHLISLPAKFFDSKRAGIIVAKVKELDSVRNFVTSSTITVIVDLVFTVVFFLIMLAYSSTLTSIVSVSVILYFVLSFIITGPLRSRVGEQFSTGAANQAFLTETIANAKAVKSLSLERPLQREWEDKTANHATANFRAVQLGMLGTEGTKLISRTTSAAVLFFGAGIVIDGDLSFGQFIAFNMFANRVSEPIIRLAQLWQDFQQARVGFRKARAFSF